MFASAIITKSLSLTVLSDQHQALIDAFGETAFYRDAGGQLIVDLEEDGAQERIEAIVPGAAAYAKEHDCTSIEFDV